MNSFIHASAFHGFIDLTRELGADPLRILKQVNISPQQLQNSENSISSFSYVKALQIAAQETDHKDFGLRLAQRQGIDLMGTVGLLARQCRTVKEMFSTLNRSIHIYDSSAFVKVEVYEQRALLTFDEVTPEMPHSPQVCDLAIALAIDLLRFFMGGAWAPHAVFFNHGQPEDLSVFKAVFRAPLQFDQDICALEFDANVLDKKAQHATPELRQFFTRYVASLQYDSQQSTTSVVRKLILSLLSTGHCTEEKIANILNINRSTLHRKLKAEGASFRQILTHTRADLAKKHLQDSDVSFTTLATKLGYSELSAFSRFFKAHFGVSPRQYRQSLEAGN